MQVLVRRSSLLGFNKTRKVRESVRVRADPSLQGILRELNRRDNECYCVEVKERLKADYSGGVVELKECIEGLSCDSEVLSELDYINIMYTVGYGGVGGRVELKPEVLVVLRSQVSRMLEMKEVVEDARLSALLVSVLGYHGCL